MKLKIKYFILFFLFISTIYAQSNQIANKSKFICNIDLNENYVFVKYISKEESFDYILDSEEKSKLKADLTSSIISIIRTSSQQSIYFSSDKVKDGYESFSSISESNSAAIIYNPKFLICENIDDPDYKTVIVYVSKDAFDITAKRFFKTLISKVLAKLNSHKVFFSNNPDYEFTKELKSINNDFKQLETYLGLVLSLNIDETSIEKYNLVELDLIKFKQAINSIDNKILKATNLVREKKYKAAYIILNDIRNRYPNNNELLESIKIYNTSLKNFKKNILKIERNNSYSFNELSIETGLNSALINNYKGNSGLENFNSNSITDRAFPFIETRFIINSRNHKFGTGLYYKYHLSQTLIVLSKDEYYFPFSDNFSEFGLMGQFFFIKNLAGNYTGALTFNLGKMNETFETEIGDKLNFLNFSSGLKIYINSNNRFYRTSISPKINFILSGREYSYFYLSLGYSINLKLGRKISENKKKEIDEEFKTIF